MQHSAELGNPRVAAAAATKTPFPRGGLDAFWSGRHGRPPETPPRGAGAHFPPPGLPRGRPGGGSDGGHRRLSPPFCETLYPLTLSGARERLTGRPLAKGGKKRPRGAKGREKQGRFPRSVYLDPCFSRPFVHLIGTKQGAGGWRWFAKAGGDRPPAIAMAGWPWRRGLEAA